MLALRSASRKRSNIWKNLTQYWEYFGQLDELPTEDVAPTYHVAEIYNVFREDVVEECLPQETVLANTEHKQDGTFRVPKIG